MKKFAWLFILQISFVALIPKADLSQLGLLSNLYQHFSEYHTNEDLEPGLEALLSFLAEHYGNTQHEHQDQDEHDQLPFKIFTSCGFLLLSQQDIDIPVHEYDEAGYTLTNTPLYPIGFSSSIDHPPSV